MTNLNNDFTDEWCPHCCDEVKLPLELGMYNCPTCGKRIVNCSMCIDMNCSQCKLANEVENED